MDKVSVATTRAQDAVNTIDYQALVELSKMRKVSDTTALIMDTIQILFKKPLDPVKPKDYYIMKQNIPFVKDSFENHTVKTLMNSRKLLKNLVNFIENQKDEINEETIELLAPYLNLELPTMTKNIK